MIHLDTSVLVDALVAPGRALGGLQRAIGLGEQVGVCSIVLFEWLRGPRTGSELSTQVTLLPETSVVSFGPPEAQLAARLYRSVARPRGREADLAIAACAILHGAQLWTLNRRDFSDIPALSLY